VALRETQAATGQLNAEAGGDQVTVPAQHGLRTHHQPHPVQHVARKPVEQGRQEGPVGGSEPDPVTMAMEPAPPPATSPTPDARSYTAFEPARY
jgi:hypothetical protein